MGVSLLRLLFLPIKASAQNVDDAGLAIGLLLRIRILGALVGFTVTSTIHNSVFAVFVASVELTGSLAQLNNSSKAVSYIPELRLLEISRSFGYCPESLSKVF
ncbi:hypothetical protein EAF04_004893 [Stromatinia cepivora]|nr:hypothetical protein EAF04_004893 [Stromatinia cepivora]